MATGTIKCKKYTGYGTVTKKGPGENLLVPSDGIAIVSAPTNGTVTFWNQSGNWGFGISGTSSVGNTTVIPVFKGMTIRAVVNQGTIEYPLQFYPYV